MAIDTLCTQTILNDQAVCYTCLGDQEQLALLVYAKALLLANLTGGTNYTATLTTTLLQDATSLNVPTDPKTLMAAYIKMALRDAALAGASVPSTVDAQVLAAKCLTCTDPKVLTLALLLLSCEIENIGSAV